MSYYLKITISIKVFAYQEANQSKKVSLIDLPAGSHIDYLGNEGTKMKFRFTHNNSDYIGMLPKELLPLYFRQVDVYNIAPATQPRQSAAAGGGGAKHGGRRRSRSRSRRSRSRSRSPA